MLHFQHFSEINTIKPFVHPVRSLVPSFVGVFMRLLCYRDSTTTMQSKYFVSTLWAGVLGIELTVRCSVKLASRLTGRGKNAAAATAKAVDGTSNKQTKAKWTKKNNCERTKERTDDRNCICRERANDDGRCLTRIETRNYVQHFLKVSQTQTNYRKCLTTCLNSCCRCVSRTPNRNFPSERFQSYTLTLSAAHNFPSHHLSMLLLLRPRVNIWIGYALLHHKYIRTTIRVPTPCHIVSNTCLYMRTIVQRTFSCGSIVFVSR